MLETALELCNGCQACYSLCPKKAIKMVVNTEGFLFPQINNDLCIECGLCEKSSMKIQNTNYKNGDLIIELEINEVRTSL